MQQPIALTSTRYSALINEAVKEQCELRKKHIEPRLRTLGWIDLVSAILMLVLAVIALIAQGSQETEVLYDLFQSHGRFYMSNGPGWSEFQAWKSEFEQCSAKTVFAEQGLSTTWDSVSFPLTSVAVASGSLAPWPWTLSVLWITFFAVLLRFCFSIFFIPMYDPVGPHFWRWFEYLLTSPIILLLVAVASGVRDQSLLIALAIGQAVLIMTGYLNELLIQQRWELRYWSLYAQVFEWEDVLALKSAVATECRTGTTQPSAPSPAATLKPKPKQDAVLQPLLSFGVKNGDDIEFCDARARDEEYKVVMQNISSVVILFHTMVQNVTDEETLSQMKNLCTFHHRTHAAQVSFKLIFSWIVSWVTFALLWTMILGAFAVQADLFNGKCTPKPNDDDDFQVPTIVYVFVYGQMGLFALFGVVQTSQVLGLFMSLRHEQKKMEVNPQDYARPSDKTTHAIKNARLNRLRSAYNDYYTDVAHNFLNATFWYTLLNIFAKGLLGACIIVISSDMQGEG